MARKTAPEPGRKREPDAPAPGIDATPGVEGVLSSPVLSSTGALSIEPIITDLATKQQHLSEYIDQVLSSGDASVGDIARLLALHGQNASRLGRLLRDQKALGGTVSSELNAAIDQALDELSKELGVDL